MADDIFGLRDFLKNYLGQEITVYVQPPSTVKMTYPCVVVERSKGNTRHADNKPYSIEMKYTITLIDKEPNSNFVSRLMALPKCQHDRYFPANNLNHDVFYMFF